MTMDFYCMMLSAPCRGALLTAKALGLEMNIKNLNLLAGEQNKPEFLAINPQHKVPTLVDGGLTLWESRAISAYLVNKYGKDDSLYPKDPKTRAQVDRLLYFDMGTLYLRYSDYAYPKVFLGGELCPKKLALIHEALEHLNTFLAGHDYAVGNSITIADHFLIVSVSTIKVSGIDVSSYCNIGPWMKRCAKNMPGYENNLKGCEDWKEVAYAKLNP